MGTGEAGRGEGRARRTGWRPAKARLRLRLYLLLALADAGAIVLAHAGAGLVRFGDPLAAETVRLAAAQLLLFGAAAFGVDAYAVPVLMRPAESVRRGLKALAGAVTAAVFLFFLLQVGAHVSRVAFAVAALFATGGLSASRWFISGNAPAILGGKPYDVVTIADGCQPPAREGCTLFLDSSGWIDPHGHSPRAFDALGRVIGRADRVVVSCPPERRAMWAAALQALNVQAEVTAPELAALQPLGVARHGGAPTMIVARAPLAWRDRVAKRGFDLVVAGSVLAVFGVPMLLIAAAVRLGDGGPALFRQRRIGRDNRQFGMLKFRTMRANDADPHGRASTARDDARVTRVGRLLRAASLDELPQFINVLRGEMSVVGPRPHAVGSRAADRLFWEVDPRYWHRHAMKPGITGLAQVRGLRGATACEEDLRARLHADLEYRATWSIWRDLAIVLRTAPVLLHRNAF